MNIIIATDSFKGSLDTLQAAHCVEKGVLRVFADAQIDIFPVADGGEGTVSALVSGCNGRHENVSVTGPLGEKVQAKFGIIHGDCAVIEMAEASGLTLVPSDKRDVMRASTYGTGELIRAALDLQCKRIMIGIGGSATNDGGVGMAQALGVSFLDQQGRELGPGGGAIANLQRIDTSGLDPRLADTEIIVMCDVDNPLCGERGASAVYGPQKGATPELVAVLDANLARFAEIVSKQLQKDIAQQAGAGAAGGLGAGLLAFLDARLCSGVSVVLDALAFDEKLPTADLVITGEGRIDGQSIYGKLPMGIGQRAKRFGVPVLVLAGSIGKDAAAIYDFGIVSMNSAVCRPMDEKEAFANAAGFLTDAAERSMRCISIGMKIASDRRASV